MVCHRRHVKGCDFGAAEELAKFRETVIARGGTLRIAQPPLRVQRTLEKVNRGDLGVIAGFQTSLQQCENELLRSWNEQMDGPRRLSRLEEGNMEMEAIALHLGDDGGLTDEAERTNMAAILFRLAEVRDVDAAESVWKGTDLASFYVVVLTGHLRLLFKDATIEELVPGSCCGYGFFAGNRGDAVRETVLLASSASRLLIISRELHNRLQDLNPALDRLLLKAMIGNASGEYRRWIHYHATNDEASNLN